MTRQAPVDIITSIDKNLNSSPTHHSLLQGRSNTTPHCRSRVIPTLGSGISIQRETLAETPSLPPPPLFFSICVFLGMKKKGVLVRIPVWISIALELMPHQLVSPCNPGLFFTSGHSSDTALGGRLGSNPAQVIFRIVACRSARGDADNRGPRPKRRRGSVCAARWSLDP